MLGAGSVFSLFSRALSRSGFQTRVLAWSYTCSSSCHCQRNVCSHSSKEEIILEDVCQHLLHGNLFLEKDAAQQNCTRPDLLHNMQHNGNFIHLNGAFIQRLQQNNIFLHFNGVKNSVWEIQGKNSEINFKQCKSAFELQDSMNKHKGVLKWPFAFSRLNTSSFHHNMIRMPLRNYYVIQNCKFNDSKHTTHSQTSLHPELLHGTIGRRHKSFMSVFKKLFLRVFKEEDLEAKEEALKEIATKTPKKKTKVTNLQQSVGSSDLAAKVVIPSKKELGDLIYGCTSSKHLLDLMVPWIEEGSVSLDDTVKVLEHLQNLVYSEIMELYPNLPYGSVPVMFQNLKLLKVEDVFTEIHKHVTFQELTKNLQQSVELLTNSQFSTCFSCLTHLGISHFHVLIEKFYIRLVNSNSKGYSVMDLVNLYNAVSYQGNISFIHAAYILPKVSECLKGLESHSIDIETFLALLTLDKRLEFSVKDSELVTLYGLLYKACEETNCLNNLDCACGLLLRLNTRFFAQKHLVQVKSVYFQLLEKHKQNVIQTMSDECILKIRARCNELSPLKIRNLVSLTKSCLNKTELEDGIKSRMEYLLKKKLSHLSLPEIIWTLAGRTWTADLEAKDVAAISRKFENLDLPNLHEAYSIGFQYVTMLDIGKLIVQKTREYRNEIIENEKLFLRALMFSWGIWSKSDGDKVLIAELDKVLQNMFVEIYQKSYNGLTTTFAVSVLMTVPRFMPLQPSGFSLLAEMAMRKSTYKALSQGNIYMILNTLCMSVFKSEQRKWKASYGIDQGLHDEVMFIVLYKTVLEFIRTLYQDTFVFHVFARTTKFFVSKGKMDGVLQAMVVEKLTESPLQSMDDLIEICRYSEVVANLRMNRKHRKAFLNIVVEFVLQNKEYLIFKDWKKIAFFLVRSGYSAHENIELQQTLQTIVHQEFSPDPIFCNFVYHCCRIGVDMSKALKVVFSVEYLSRIDQLVSEKLIKKAAMQKTLFMLNQIACVSYPSLKVPWFQDERDLAKSYKTWYYRLKFYPKDLHDAITSIAGGDRYVGKDVFLKYGIPAWRVLLLDKNNKFMEFSTRNLELASEMKYKVFFIMYITARLGPGSGQVTLELVTQAGYKPVVIFTSEWHSIGLQTKEDKMEFLRERIAASSDNFEVHDPPTVNCSHLSDQWKEFLRIKGKTR